MKQRRSAITGQYVTKQYAKRHLKTTVIEQVKPSTPPQKGKK